MQGASDSGSALWKKCIVLAIEIDNNKTSFRLFFMWLCHIIKRTNFPGFDGWGKNSRLDYQFIYINEGKKVQKERVMEEETVMIKQMRFLDQVAFRCSEPYMEMNIDIQFLLFILPLFQSYQICSISLKFTSLVSAGALCTKEYIILDNSWH